MRAIWLVPMLLLAFGCAKQSTNAPTAAEPASNGASQKVVGADGYQGEVIGTIAPGSKFSRVQIGMSLREVEDRIGQPSDTAAHITGKAFIPFYFGGDTSLTEVFYPGEGQLSFARASFGSSALRLARIIVDRSEKGYAH